jgi:Amt family ammonium transporter
VNQGIGILIAFGLAIIGTIVILKVVDLIVGVRVSQADEIEGLDLRMHGEEGYALEG